MLFMMLGKGIKEKEHEMSIEINLFMFDKVEAKS